MLLYKKLLLMTFGTTVVQSEYRCLSRGSNSQFLALIESYVDWRARFSEEA